jgi:hypothetical protein
LSALPASGGHHDPPSAGASERAAGAPVAGERAARARRPPQRRAVRRAVVVAVAAMALALVGALGAASASAGTTYVDGISDQNLGLWQGDYLDGTGLFTQPFTSFFQGAWVGSSGSEHLQYARFVTAPDAVAQGGACEANLDNWFTYVTQTLHLIPVIAVWDVAEGGCANHGAPSSSAYATDIGQLLTHLDSLYAGTTVPYIEAWNEPNSSGVPAATAAGYWTAANGVCATAGCTAIAGDFVDNDPDQGSQSFAPGCAANLTYNNLATYERNYVTALGTGSPAIWGFHPYFAVNCEQSTSVATFEDNLPTPAGQIWFTEVGAWECVKGQSTPRGVARQQADAAYLVNTLMSASSPGAPAHVFWYGMAADGYTLDCSKYADSELYEAASSPGPLAARPAAATIYGADTTLAAAAAPVSGVTSTQATFNGTVTPGGIYEASYYFNYGPSTAATYGSQTTPVALGPGLAPQQVSATVGGLDPGTPYHYQLVVTDTNGLTVDGADVSVPPVVVAASPTSLTAGQQVTVSWSGISNPTSDDWFGLYQPGAADGAYLDFFYADSCTQSASGPTSQSGSCTYTMPSAPGTYEIRLYSTPASGLLTASGSITSLPPPPVNSAPPTISVNSAAPAISGESGAGVAFPGDTLTCSNGSWSNSPSAFMYQWDSDGSALAGATMQSYLAPQDELGDALSCTVAAANAGGSGSPAASATVAVVSPRPVSSAPPTISGSTVVGRRLSESHATWSNAPTSFTYQWQRCNRRGANCRAIAGATRRTYAVALADAASTLRVLETAANSRATSAPASSQPTAVVTVPPAGVALIRATILASGASASFRFRATGVSIGLRCALVRSPMQGATTPRPDYVACRSPLTFDHLQAGRYVFHVRAVELDGAAGGAISYTFAVP